MTRRAPSKRFIDVPAVDLLAEINAIGAAVVAKGGQLEEIGSGKRGREIMFALRPPNSRAEVRIYTSVARGSAHARDCGDDAIRLCWGFWGSEKFKPLSKAVRVFRTAPAGEPEARLRAFLERFRAAVREVYAVALRAPSCPRCAAPMVERASGQRAFWGCSAFPSCRGSRPWGTDRSAELATSKVHYTETINAHAQDRAAHELSGHEVVALYGMPHGEMAAQQVQDGLDAEADADPFGHAIYEGGSALAQAIIRGDRKGRWPL